MSNTWLEASLQQKKARVKTGADLQSFLDIVDFSEEFDVQLQRFLSQVTDEEGGGGGGGGGHLN